MREKQKSLQSVLLMLHVAGIVGIVHHNKLAADFGQNGKSKENMKTSKSQANILSNLSFVLVDIIESCFIEANEKLKSENCEFKHEAKREFNLLLSHCRNLKRYVRNCSEETQEFFGKDSDMLYQALKLIIDRCGTDDVKLFKFFTYIKTIPSQIDMYIDDTVFNGVCKKQI